MVVPEGRLKGKHVLAHSRFSRPSGTEKEVCSLPTVKTVGYSHSSLRDFRNRNWVAMLYGLSEKIRRNEPIPALLSCLLSACTPLVRAGMWIRKRRRRVRVDAHVISFGNITAGGTGKTPAVIERAKAESAAGKKVAVLTRGYGSRQQSGVVAVTGDSAGREELAALVGDEPALILRKARGVMVCKSADRIAAAKKAIGEYRCDTLILDDGFQYVQLERDENIVLIDATNPFGNGHLIPRGILREPLSELGRATQIYLSRCDQVADLSPVLERLEKLCPDVPIRMTRHEAAGLWRVHDGEELPMDYVKGKRALAVCAIGNPEAFFETLERLGVDVTERRAYRDHGEIEQGLVESSELVITTEKDAMRMRNAGANVLALGIDLKTHIV